MEIYISIHASMRHSLYLSHGSSLFSQRFCNFSLFFAHTTFKQLIFFFNPSPSPQTCIMLRILFPLGVRTVRPTTPRRPLRDSTRKNSSETLEPWETNDNIEYDTSTHAAQSVAAIGPRSEHVDSRLQQVPVPSVRAPGGRLTVAL